MLNRQRLCPRRFDAAGLQGLFLVYKRAAMLILLKLVLQVHIGHEVLYFQKTRKADIGKGERGNEIALLVMRIK